MYFSNTYINKNMIYYYLVSFIIFLYAFIIIGVVLDIIRMVFIITVFEHIITFYYCFSYFLSFSSL